ncbi:rhomboid family intramembrane serine protease [Chitinophagaceae bacterium LWZ2-11]
MTEFRPNRFEILPVVIKNLLIINGLVFLAQYITEQQGIVNMDDLFALHTFQSQLFKPWQLITHMFMHGSIGHILSNMFVLWMFGSTLENLWGPKRFLIFYLVCGLGAALCHMGVLYYENQKIIDVFNSLPFDQQQASQAYVQGRLNSATLGASGAVFGCLAAFGYLFPNTKIYLYFLLPIKAKWFVILYAVFELVMAVQNSAGDDVAHVAHLGGALVGFLLVYFWNKTNRSRFY